MIFVDDHTRFRVALGLKKKSDAFEAFKTFKAWAENILGLKIKALHDDKGGEYMSNTFNRFLDQCGIERRHTTRNRPQQNGDAERANRTLKEVLECALTRRHSTLLTRLFYPEGPDTCVHCAADFGNMRCATRRSMRLSWEHAGCLPACI